MFNVYLEAGIDGDYKMASTQAKLIHYGMFHGQWIGVVSPTDAKDFIKGTNVDQLTIAFLKNFERAGVENTSTYNSCKNGSTSY